MKLNGDDMRRNPLEVRTKGKAFRGNFVTLLKLISAAIDARTITL